jgi:hypothetical protein
MERAEAGAQMNVKLINMFKVAIDCWVPTCLMADQVLHDLLNVSDEHPEPA